MSEKTRRSSVIRRTGPVKPRDIAKWQERKKEPGEGVSDRGRGDGFIPSPSGRRCPEGADEGVATAISIVAK